MEGGDLRMSSSIDEKVVRLLFDNKQFEQGVSSSLASLDKLNKGLKLDGAAKGLDQIQSSANKLSLSSIANGVDNIASKFKTMSIVGITAITNLANRAVSAGISFAKSLSVNPIMAGLHEYETNLNSIQTVLANTGLEGQSGLNKVNAALQELNTYSDKTIYNFSEMAKNIGTFTAAGVDLKTSTAAIKGIANLAAISGSSADQASTAMYQLSQSLASGKVTLEDWNSVVNAGMGGKVFQQSLIQTAKAHGVAVDKIIKDEGSFRNSLQKGWLTSSVLTETLSKFTGDLNARQLKSMGYNKQQIADIMKMAKTAQDAATKVKTFSQLIDTLQEAVGSGWTQTWQILFGDFNEARDLFTGISNVLGGFVSASSNARNKVLGDWKTLGGRTVLIDAIRLAFNALIAVLKPIKDAFREIFPAKTGADLFDLTKKIHAFAENLLISGDTADKIKRTLAGLFAVFKIGIDIVKGVASVIFALFKQIFQGSGSFLEITANIGDFLVALQKAIENGDDLTKFFAKLGAILALPIKLLQVLAQHLSGLFDGFDGDKAAKGVENVGKKLNPLGRIMDTIRSGGDNLVKMFDHLLDNIGPIFDKIFAFFQGVGDAISNGLSGVNFDHALKIVNTGLFAGLLLLLKNFLGKFKSDDSGLGSIVDSIKETFGALTDTLSAMQTTLKATTLLEIAAAIGLLTISVVALSKIDTDSLKKALAAIAIMFTQLFASMAVFNKIAGGSGFGKMILIGAAMIEIATAVDILVVAVTALAQLNWKELSKGLAGIGVLLGAIAGALQLMPTSASMISTGLGLIALAYAIQLLVTSVTNLDGLSWTEMAKGLSGVAGLLVSLALFTKFASAGKAGVLQGAGIVLLATGIRILVSAVQDFGKMSWKEIGKGLTTMAGGLAAIGLALYLIPPSSVLSAAGVLLVAQALGTMGDAIKSMAKMSWKDIGKGLTVMAGGLTLIAAALYVLPPSSLLSAAAILIVAASLSLISDALKDMAKMSWSEIGKGLTVLAGSLGIIATALFFMEGALPGAAALVVVVGALMLLNPVLQAYAGMSWGEIAKGLTMLAGVFVVIGLAGLVLAPLVPVLIGLGAAITLMGIGVLAAGAGVFLFATALTALAAAGTVSAAAMTAIITGLLGLLPTVAKAIGEAVVAFAETIGKAGPAITKAIVTVLNALINAIGILAPKIYNTLAKMAIGMANTLADNVPKLVNAGLRLLNGVLTGIANNIGKIITSATNIAVRFIQGIALNLPRVIDAGVQFIIAFINGLARAINDNSAALGTAGGNLAAAIISGMVRGLGAGVGVIASKAASVAKSALDSAKHVLGINSPSKEFEKIGNYVNDGFRKGLDGNRGQIDTAFNNLKKMLDSLAKSSKASAKERAKAKSISASLSKSYADEHKALDNLANRYDTVTAKLKAATDTLANAKKTRDDYNKSVKDQYDDLPDISATTKVSDFETGLKKQIEDTKQFANALARLRKLGLSDKMYKELLAQGPDALPFAKELLAGGKSKVQEVNNLGSQLDAAASQLGKQASSALYQAAVDSAQGLVDGLKKQQAAIEKQMDKIADAMVKAIKKKLGIKSPSKVFHEVGDFSGQGLAEGLMGTSAIVQRSAEAVGIKAVDTLKKSLSNVADLVVTDVDLKPRITPVLDLSSVKKDAGRIGGLLSTPPISVTDAYSKARIVQSGYMSAQEPATSTGNDTPSQNVTNYTQNNYSPKALSQAEIYRQTKNQLSKAKGALATNAQQGRNQD
jgi:tape measure domain-containing protein